MSVTSYAALFRAGDDGGLGLVGIQIPMIQRDYAQGREDPRASRIRNDFIATLTAAVTLDSSGAVTPVGLDFVYGDVRQGVLLPLDGQQRLTALFLLHWYLAVRSGGTDALWLNFAYETRASARQFCEELRKIASLGNPIEGKPDFSAQGPSEWIKDQSWFMPGWTGEPTIASMLVVLENIRQEVIRLIDQQHGACQSCFFESSCHQSFSFSDIFGEQVGPAFLDKLDPHSVGKMPCIGTFPGAARACQQQTPASVRRTFELCSEPR